MCQHCKKKIYGAAEKLREHAALERRIERIHQETGILLVRPREIEVVGGNHS